MRGRMQPAVLAIALLLGAASAQRIHEPGSVIRGQTVNLVEEMKKAAPAPAAAAAGPAKAWPNSKASDKTCVPFDPTKYKHPNMDSFCDKLNSLSDKELLEMHANAPKPTATQGFPLRGCTHRCIAGSSFAALTAKDPKNNMGWGGKCFTFDLDPATGVPKFLDNIFSFNYDNKTLPDHERVKGFTTCRATVNYRPRVFADGQPAWVFDHSESEDLYDPVRKMNLVVKAFRDEMREVRPGFLMGRIFLQTGPGVANELPIFFALFQACAADGSFPDTLEKRVSCCRLGAVMASLQASLRGVLQPAPRSSGAARAGAAAPALHGRATPVFRAPRALSVQAQRRSGAGGRPGRQLALDVAARRRDDWRRAARGGGAGDRPSLFRFKLGSVDVSLAEEQLWRLALPLTALFGIAVVIGPVVVGFTLSAVAVGAAFSAGALAFSTLLLPLILLASLGGLMSFSLMAGLGLALVVPKLVLSALSMAVVGGGLLAGFGTVNWLLAQQAGEAGSSAGGSREHSGAASEDDGDDDDDGGADVSRIASELREFDELLARREERRRVDEWRARERP
ncbi:hypothetical protein HT031_001877 [Scenedesmus sp. PABB004]|nr:hypothetical protein HT031_001877 [Scenedesmus sp. PABB004]